MKTTVINDKKIIDSISTFAKKKILVIGEIILDEYLSGSVERISPEAPVPIIHFNNTQYFLGGGGNVLRNLKSFGADVYMISVFGRDEAAKKIGHLLKEADISQDRALIYPSKERKTIRKIRVLSRNQQICRIDYEDVMPSTEAESEYILDQIKSVLPHMDAVILSDYDKGLLTEKIISFVIQQAKNLSVFIAVDPQVKNFPFYKDIDLMTPNHLETGNFLGINLEKENIKENGMLLRKKMGIQYLLITQGSAGMTLFASGVSRELIEHFPTRAREIYDVTGAGDTVISILTLALCSRIEIRDAVTLANIGAGLVISRLGATVLSERELVKGIIADDRSLLKEKEYKNVKWQ